MTSKKIIFCDIDGTLSKKGHPISKENINAIATFIKEGNMFVLSTGRSIVSANKYNKQIHEACGHFPEYTISSNGGYIRKNSTNEATRFYMESAIARRVYDYARANKLWALIYTDEANDKNAALANGVWFWPVVKTFKNLNVIRIKPETDLTSFKIVITAWSDRRICKMMEWIRENISEHVSAVHTHKLMLEITAKDINKGSAIKHILAETEIDKKDAIAIGDSQNDIPAFFECGDSYSIKSKDKKVLETASHSIPYFKNAIRDIISNIIKNK